MKRSCRQGGENNRLAINWIRICICIGISVIKYKNMRWPALLSCRCSSHLAFSLNSFHVPHFGIAILSS